MCHPTWRGEKRQYDGLQWGLKLSLWRFMSGKIENLIPLKEWVSNQGIISSPELKKLENLLIVNLQDVLTVQEAAGLYSEIYIQNKN